MFVFAAGGVPSGTDLTISRNASARGEERKTKVGKKKGFKGERAVNPRIMADIIIPKTTFLFLGHREMTVCAPRMAPYKIPATSTESYWYREKEKLFWE